MLQFDVTLSRRQAFGLAAATLGASLLSACGGPKTPAEFVVGEWDLSIYEDIHGGLSSDPVRQGTLAITKAKWTYTPRVDRRPQYGEQKKSVRTPRGSWAIKGRSLTGTAYDPDAVLAFEQWSRVHPVAFDNVPASTKDGQVEGRYTFYDDDLAGPQNTSVTVQGDRISISYQIGNGDGTRVVAVRKS